MDGSPMHANCKRFISPLLMAAFTLFGVASATASSVIVGGTGLLTQSGVDQLATWLGEGDLQLTNVFTHSKKDDLKNSVNFHTDADGKGRTFTIAEVKSVGGVSATIIVGGYNPKSWYTAPDSDIYYNVGATNNGRTAFLYNLTEGYRLDEKSYPRINDPGQYQTVNASGYGPGFGGGFDLITSSNLNSGSAAPSSYEYLPFSLNPPTTVVGSNQGSVVLTFDKLDVFTISAVAPLPSTVLMGVALLGGFALLQVRRRIDG